jgi:hypothetical protein
VCSVCMHSCVILSTIKGMVHIDADAGSLRRAAQQSERVNNCAAVLAQYIHRHTTPLLWMRCLCSSCIEASLCSACCSAERLLLSTVYQEYTIERSLICYYDV